ncbi:sensor histidine kinase [Brumicola blandensis]|uniref:histidine kinase n=1 Tax=Brumicola blandensis TaxID=3075611 RepID=A0AAW8QZ00_9ALTE|nr:ATP-binding protein [Alteromonas sp. W409]MDT0582009.1 ATP-binding protein [Alteromonas sp. W409]
MTNQINLTEGKSTRSTWGFILFVFLLLVGVNSYLSRTTINELSDLQTEIRKSSRIVGLLQQLHVQVLRVESGQRGFLLSEDPMYLKQHQQSISEIDQLVERFAGIESSDESQQLLMRELLHTVEIKLSEIQKVISQVKETELTQALKVYESEKGQQLYSQVHQMIQQLKENEQSISDAQIAELEKVTQESERNLIISFSTTMILVCGLFFLVRINLRTQQERQEEIELQNEKLQNAVEERTNELSLYSEELTRSNRELEDFAFVASHDLQEPLRKIMAFGDRLESQADALNDKQLDYLQRMRGAAARMSKLISDLLEFSRVNTKGREFQEVDLNIVVAETLDDLNVLIEESGVSLTIAELPTVTADAPQMQQLFFNLIANAVKFSEQNESPSVEVRVNSVPQPEQLELEGLSNWYCFEIIDNGIGFDQEHAEKIFAPFQRLHSRSEYKGTGIGLAICRRIVERHNGIITASGESGKGATFSVTLPASNYLNSIKQS